MAQEYGPPRGEIRALTGLRLVAALWVVVHHFWLFSPDTVRVRLLEPLGFLLEAGWLGVDLFFLLSGFVLTHNCVASLGRRPGAQATVEFYWARLSRIWPTWMVVLTAVTAGLVVERLALGRTTSPLDAPTMLRQVLLIQVWDRPDYSATGPVGPGWSLSAEWLAYLLFPAVVVVLHRLRSGRPAVLGALAVAAVAPFALACLVRGSHDWDWSWLLRLAGCFLAGALVSLCLGRIRSDGAASRAAPLVAACAITGIVLVVRLGEGVSGVAVLFFPVLVGALGLRGAGAARVLATPVMVLGGRISFALYLVHMGLFEACWTALDLVPALRDGSPVAVLAQGVVAVLPLPAAWLLWRTVEEPARRWLRRIGPHRPAASDREPVPALVPAR